MEGKFRKQSKNNEEWSSTAKEKASNQNENKNYYNNVNGLFITMFRN